jgi:hypothetical protein
VKVLVSKKEDRDIKLRDGLLQLSHLFKALVVCLKQEEGRGEIDKMSVLSMMQGFRLTHLLSLESEEVP